LTTAKRSARSPQPFTFDADNQPRRTEGK
jgi:hypothetical protein